MKTPGLLLAAALLLAASSAAAGRYDPDADRAALREAATLCHSTLVDATGLPLEPEKAPAIAAGLDEGLRRAKLAADAARSLDAAARGRGAAMAAGVKDAALDGRLKELAEPVAAERRRWERLTGERAELKEKLEALPEERRKKLLPLFSKAGAGLRAAGEALRPLEDSVRVLAEKSPVLKEIERDSRGLLVEISSAAAGVEARAGILPAGAEEVRARLADLGKEPREAARARAWEKIVPLRDIARLLFQSADSACNRADEYRRLSSSFERAADDFERARRGAAAGPAGARASLDEAHKLHQELREALKGP